MSPQRYIERWATWMKPRLIPLGAAAAVGIFVYWLSPRLSSKDAAETWLAHLLAASPLSWFGPYPVVFAAQWLPLIAPACVVAVLVIAGRLLPGVRPTPLSRFLVLVLLGVAFFGALELDVYPHLPEAIRRGYAVSNSPDPIDVLAVLMLSLLAMFVIVRLARGMRDQ